MTLQEYVKEQKELLDKFEAGWTLMSLAHPELYPMQIDNPGDWDEQFQLYYGKF